MFRSQRMNILAVFAIVFSLTLLSCQWPGPITLPNSAGLEFRRTTQRPIET